MNLSPYLSFCGEFTGVICFLAIRGYRKKYVITMNVLIPSIARRGFSQRTYRGEWFSVLTGSGWSSSERLLPEKSFLELGIHTDTENTNHWVLSKLRCKFSTTRKISFNFLKNQFKWSPIDTMYCNTLLSQLTRDVGKSANQFTVISDNLTVWLWPACPGESQTTYVLLCSAARWRLSLQTAARFIG